MRTLALTFLGLICYVSANAQTEKLLFQSGFEKGTQMVSDLDRDVLRGKDLSVKTQNDWTVFSTKNGYPFAGNFSLFYEGGDSTKRKARLVPDPKDSSNTVLKFTVYEANAVKSENDKEAYKTRIQGQVGNVKEGIKRYYQSVRMYFPSSTMKVLDKFPKAITWFSIAEFWNNAAWGTVPADPYRLTVGIGHQKGANNPFYFHFSSDKYRIQFKADGRTPEKYIPTKIKGMAADFKIPTDTWLTVEYYYQEGNWTATSNRPAGHFYMTVQPAGGKKEVLFNERVATLHPDQTVEPDGLTVYHPLKFYTNKQIANFMKTNKTPMEIFWDDLKIYSDKIPDGLLLKNALSKP